jgi:hypothetical protein
MPDIIIPLLKGDGRSSKNADYVDLLPTNILPVFRAVDDDEGYFRFFPGIDKLQDVSGVSRGAHWNTVKNLPYRVAGDKLYLDGVSVGDVAAGGRVSMAHGRTSQAVANNGALTMYRYDGEVKVLSNWTGSETFPGFDKSISKTVHNQAGDSLIITPSTETGALTFKITPITRGGNTGTTITRLEADFSTPYSQPKPALGIPYIIDLKITGIKFAGAALQIKYKFIPNLTAVTNPWSVSTVGSTNQARSLRTIWSRADIDIEQVAINMGFIDDEIAAPESRAVEIAALWAEIDPINPSAVEVITFINDNLGNIPSEDFSVLEFTQKVEDTVIPNPQYDWGDVGDVCRIRGRYVFAEKGTDRFWLTSLEDESKPDKIAPAYSAENMPDGIIAVREWRDFILAFGSSTIEFFRLTGNSENLVQVQPSYMVPIGIAGQFAITAYMDTFAFITSPSRGQVIVATMGQGVYTEISGYLVNSLLAEYTPAELSTVVLESLSFTQHKLLILHLPRETLLYDAARGNWVKLKTGLYDDVYRGIDFSVEGGRVTCGDKLSGFLGVTNDTSSSQYGVDQEIILYTPLLNAPNFIGFDMEITSGQGLSSVATRMLISSTEDGIIYGKEVPVIIDKPAQWLGRSLLRRIGRIRGRIGFKLRVVGATPVTLSRFKMRLE